MTMGEIEEVDIRVITRCHVMDERSKLCASCGQYSPCSTLRVVARIATLEREIERATNDCFRALQERNEELERVATMEDGIRWEIVSTWDEESADRLRALLNASHDQEHKACPDCNVEPDEDGWLPYGHDPECKFDAFDVTSIDASHDGEHLTMDVQAEREALVDHDWRPVSDVNSRCRRCGTYMRGGWGTRFGEPCPVLDASHDRDNERARQADIGASLPTGFVDQLAEEADRE